MGLEIVFIIFIIGNVVEVVGMEDKFGFGVEKSVVENNVGDGFVKSNIILLVDLIIVVEEVIVIDILKIIGKIENKKVEKLGDRMKNWLVLVEFGIGFSFVVKVVFIVDGKLGFVINGGFYW